MSLDEQALRRPDFRGGVKVRLADGQEWTFPLPVLVFVPDDSADRFHTEWDLGEEYAELTKATGGGVGADWIRFEMDLARYLLCLNYTLDTAALGQLLRFRYDSAAPAETVEMMEAIRRIASGVADVPKPQAVGSD